MDLGPVTKFSFKFFSCSQILRLFDYCGVMFWKKPPSLLAMLGQKIKPYSVVVVLTVYQPVGVNNKSRCRPSLLITSLFVLLLLLWCSLRLLHLA